MTDQGKGATLDLRALAVFMAVVEAGNVTAAARKLGITQPAVSHVLRRLETDIGAKLLDRGLRPLRLTAAGDMLQRHARSLLADAEKLAAAVRDTGSPRRFAIRIGLIDSFAATAGPDLVRGLRPHADSLLVWSGIASALGPELLNRRLDFIVTSDPLAEYDGLVRHRLVREPYLIVVPERFGAEADLSVEQLVRRLPLIRYSSRSVIGIQIEQHLRRLRIAAPREMEFDGTETLFAMVAAGIGWAITTPLCLLQGRAHLDGLIARRLPSPSLTRSIHLVARESENAAIVATAVELSQRTVRRLIARDLAGVAPWVADEMAVD